MQRKSRVRTISAILVIVVPTTAAGSQAVEAGDIFVANISANTVTRYDRAGAYEGVFVKAGAGGLVQPTGLAFGPDGFLYVASSGTDRVLRYEGRTGVFRDTFIADPNLRRPFSLIFGPDGDLYVSSGSDDRVLRYDGAIGAFRGVAAAGGGLRQPIGLRFGADGTLYVASSAGGEILRFDPATGRSLGAFASGLKFPSDLVFGRDGTLYVTSATDGTVRRFDGRTGAPEGIAVRLPEGGAPVGIDVALDGRLVIGDFAGNRLFVATPGREGRPRPVSREGLAGPENLVVLRERP